MSDDGARAEVTVLRSREAWRAAAIGYLGFCALVGALGGLVGHGAFAVLAMFSFGSYGAIVWLPIVWMWSRSNQIRVEPKLRAAVADEKGLFVDGGPSIPRATITCATVSPSWPTGAYVRVERKHAFTRELWTPDPQAAHGLVRALGLDAHHMKLSVGGPSRVPWFALGITLVAMIFAGFATALDHPGRATAALLLGLVVLALRLAPTRFVVGADGIQTQWLSNKRFIPIASIASVEQRPGVARVHLRDGGFEDLELASRVSSGEAAIIGLRVGVLAERIRDAMRRAGTLEVDTTLLERGEQDLPTWLAGLRELSRGAGYRSAFHRDDLAYVAEDARKPAQIRIAAAIALGKLEEHDRVRLRVAAESTSLPEVKDAFDAVIEGDEAIVAERLARLPTT